MAPRRPSAELLPPRLRTNHTTVMTTSTTTMAINTISSILPIFDVFGGSATLAGLTGEPMWGGLLHPVY